MTMHVLAFGEGEDGQLGIDWVPHGPAAVENSATTFVQLPTAIPCLSGVQFRSRELGRSPVMAGSRNSMALSEKGELYSWGWNQRGTLGHGAKSACQKNPRKIEALLGKKVVQAAVGGWHCLALTSEGRIYAWGGNEYMQCGIKFESPLNGTPPRDFDIPMPLLPKIRFRQVSAGGMHSMALSEEGEVWEWGQPLFAFANQDYNQDRSPRRVVGSQDGLIVKVAAGAFFSLATREDGAVYSWGHNEYGQLGLGNTTYTAKPSRIPGLEHVKIVDCAAGGWHGMVITDRGEVFCWGRGEYGRLGLGADQASKLSPVYLEMPNEEKVAQISLGGTHSMFLTDTAQVFVCGRGAFGRLGVGDVQDYTQPVIVDLKSHRAVGITCGGRHSLIVIQSEEEAAAI